MWVPDTLLAYANALVNQCEWLLLISLANAYQLFLSLSREPCTFCMLCGFLLVEQKRTMVEDNELTSYVGDHRRTYEFQLWTLRNHDEASSLHEGSTQLGHKIGKFKTLTLTAIYT